MTELVARVPTKPLTWQLTSPCGSCAGCRTQIELTLLLRDVDVHHLNLAKHMNVLGMRTDNFFACIEALVTQRNESRERLLSQLGPKAQCERLEIVAE